MERSGSIVSLLAVVTVIVLQFNASLSLSPPPPLLDLIGDVVVDYDTIELSSIAPLRTTIFSGT